MIEQNIPVLLVGLGGVGGSIVDKIMERIPDSDRSFVGAVAIDTDIGDLNKLKNVKRIWMGNDGIVKDLLLKYPEYKEWFPTNKFINTRVLTQGAGQIRAIARLVMAASMRSDNNPLIQLDDEIKRILAHDGSKSITRFNVFITGSITGGTGAGSFLQIPYYIKDYLKQNMPNLRVRIRGMFVGSDITVAVNPSRVNRDAVKINAYACMKELNALYLMQSDQGEDHEKLEFEYYDNEEWKDEFELALEQMLEYGEEDPGENIEGEEYHQRIKELFDEGGNIPYDSFYLVEGTDNKGTTGESGLEAIKSQVASIIYTMLFTAIAERADSVENNETLLDCLCNGMNRYSSAGLCTLRYPYDQIKEYVSLRFCQKMVNNEWLFIDHECEQEIKDAKRRQKSDPTVQIPEIKDVFTRKFEKATDGDEATLGNLRLEAYTITDEKTRTMKCKMNIFLDKIDHRINKILQDPYLNDLKTVACESSTATLETNPLKEIGDRTGKAEDYARTMINIAENNRYQVANEVFPQSYESLLMRKNSDLSVYKFIGNTHPVAARFLCYMMILELDKRIANLEDRVRDTEVMILDDIDYDPTTEKIDSAKSVLRNSNNKSKKYLFLGSNKNSTAKEVANLFEDGLEEQIERIEQYGEDEIKDTTYRILRNRFEQLAENYATFFETIQSRIDSNEESIENLERSYLFKPYGAQIVYGSPEAFKMSFAKFADKKIFSIPKESNEAVFLGLFRSIETIFDVDENPEMSDESKTAAKLQVKAEINDLFDTAVMQKMKDYVKVEGDKTINISIKEAIAEQMKLEGKRYIDDKAFEKARLEYENNLIDLAMAEAAPMVAAKDDENTSENVYIALHPDSAERRDGKMSREETESRLARTTAASDMQKPTILISEGFSRYEIVCMKAKHKYRVEQLAKYLPKSDYQKLYLERIANIGKIPKTSGAGSEKTVVTPHLSRYWHEVGFIPELTVNERILRKRKILKAFIYAMGMDVFVQEKMAGMGDLPRWKYINIKDNRVPVKEKGYLIRTGYVDLYRSLINNRNLVDSIIKRAQDAHKTESRTMGVMESSDRVNKLKLLKDLIQEIPEDGDSNILDIFDEMLRNEFMREPAWDNLFEGLRLALTEYLHDIYPKNYIHANEIYKDAIDRMYKASKCGKKEEASKAEGKEASLDDIEKRIRYHMQQLQAVNITY